MPASLLERTTEVERLTDALTAAAGGAGRAVLVEGPPGIGKSALLRGVREEAARRGVTALRAWGDELGAAHPFGVARQLLERPVHERPDRALGGPATLAEPLFRAGASSLEVTASDAEFSLAHGLYWLVTNLAADGPLVLVVDDAHWADLASLHWLEYLVRRLEDLPVLLLVGARRTARPQVDAVIAGIGRDAEVLRPRSLSAEGAQALLAAALDAEPSAAFTEACMAATGGNPFLLRELAASVLHAGVAPGDAAVGEVAALRPASVARAVLRRLADLPAGAIEVAEALATVGDGADIALLATLCGRPPEEVVALTDHLAAAHVLQPGTPPVFEHALLRDVLRDELSVARRSALHAQAARWRAAHGASATEVAAHLLQTEPAADAWTVERLRAAADVALAAGSSSAAGELLDRALREPPARDLLPDVLFERGRAAARAGDDDDAIDHLRAALDGLTVPVSRARCGHELGRVLLVRGRADEAFGVFGAALGDLPAGEALLEQLIHGDLSVATFASRAALRLAAGLPAIPSARGEGPLTQAERLREGRAAGVHCVSGARPPADVADMALASVPGLTVDHEIAASPAAYTAATSLMAAGWPRTAHAIYSSAIELGRERVSRPIMAMACCWRSRANLHIGDVGEAIEDARTALTLTHDASLLLGSTVTAAFLAEALLEAGEIEEAAATLRRSRAVTEAPDSVLELYRLVAESRVALAQSRPEEALELARRASAELEDWGVRTQMFVAPLRDEALALARLGRDEEARAAAEANLEHVRAWPAAGSLAHALRLVGTLSGDLDASREAVAVAADSEETLAHAYALVDLGAALRRAGARSEAREPLREGLALARHGGAVVLAERAHDELAATGASVQRMRRAGVEALTPSEARVARMAAEGESNREIAAALFVTVRTVEAHLRHAYGKLGIRGRAELAAALTRPE